MKMFIQNRSGIFLMLAAVFWFGLYKILEPLSRILVHALPPDPASHT